MSDRARFLSVMERAVHLKSVHALGTLSTNELAGLAVQADEMIHGRGDAIFRPGEPVGGFHVIAEGRVHAQGAEHGDTELGPGDTLGLLSALSEWETGVSATALTEVISLRIDLEDLRDLLEDHTSLLMHQMESLASATLAQRLEIEPGRLLAPEKRSMEIPDRNLDLIERLLLMRRGPFFEHANMDALVRLAQSTREEHFDAGVQLWDREDPSGFMYLVARGTVRCELAEEGRYFRAGPGYPLGNIESVARRPRWYTATTETPVLAMRAESEFLLDLIEDHIEMGMTFVAALATGQLRLLEEQWKRKSAEAAAASESDSEPAKA